MYCGSERIQMRNATKRFSRVLSLTNERHRVVVEIVRRSVVSALQHNPKRCRIVVVFVVIKTRDKGFNQLF